MGYRHFSEAPLYLFHGRLYKVPPSEVEHSIFAVEPSRGAEHEPPAHPRGGHNYYNGRDMELLQRRIGWTIEAGLGRTADWTEAFLRRVKEDDCKWHV